MSREIDISGLDELEKDIQKVIDQYPDETNKKLRQVANHFKNDCNKKMPASYKKGKRPIPKSWSTHMETKLHVATEAQIANEAPHFHLVENGHQKFIRGKDTGEFVPGKHYAEKTRAEYEEKFPDEITDFLNEILKGNNL